MKTLIPILFYFLLPLSGYGQIITSVAGNGVSGNSGDYGYATNAQIKPISLTVDKNDNIYVSCGAVIRKVSYKHISTIAGTGTTGYEGDGGQATNAKINSGGILVDTAGNLYFTQWQGGVIRKVNTSGTISTIAGNGTSGYNGDNIPATNANLNAPYGVVMDKYGSIYLSDLANHRVRKISTTGIITTIAGNGSMGYSGDGGPATLAELNYPGFLSFGPDGNLYWPEHPNKIVRKLEMTTGIISTVAGNGAMGYGGDGGPATAAMLIHPNGVVVDTAGNIYIADYGANVVRKVEKSTSFISTVAGTGLSGFSGDNGPATAAQLKNPNCVAMDKWGNVYISDVSNFRIRCINYNPLAIDEISKSEIKATIHPNPASTQITINATTPINALHLINTLGQLVLTQQPHTNETVVNIHHLPPGIYLIKINGSPAGKFIKE